MMNFTDLAKTIAKFGAPLIATAIAGPSGGAIASIIAEQFGGDIKDPLDLAQKIIADPTAAVKLAEIQGTNKVELQKLIIASEDNRLRAETEQMKIAYDNTADARKNNSVINTHYPEILSTLIVAGFLLCIYWIAAYPQQSEDKDVLYLLLGTLGASFGAVISYWLGGTPDKKMGK